jgi:multicomponent K+:H+ antiporter subunit E
MRRLLPSPLLSCAVLVLWLLLRDAADASTLATGALVALVAPRLAASLRPAPVRMRRPGLVARLLVRVVWDSLRSNLAVMAAIVRRRAVRSGFVRIPLDVRDPNALAVLAMIVTAVPGTAWGELAFDRDVLLIHVLSLEDEAQVVATIKTRYERPLMEIFE